MEHLLGFVREWDCYLLRLSQTLSHPISNGLVHRKQFDALPLVERANGEALAHGLYRVGTHGSHGVHR